MPTTISEMPPSAVAAVTGRAAFSSDRAPARDALIVRPVHAPFGRATLGGCEVSKALALPGVHAVLAAPDIPGRNGGCLPESEIEFHGQPVALVVAENASTAVAAAEAIEIDYAPLPPVLDIAEAVEVGRFHGEPMDLSRGDVEGMMAQSANRISGSLRCPSQDPLGIEPPCAFAEPDGVGGIVVGVATSRPGIVQERMADLLGIPMADVRIVLPMESHPGDDQSECAAFAALAAFVTRRPVAVRYGAEEAALRRRTRPAASAQFNAGFDAEGRIAALSVALDIDGGSSGDDARTLAASALHHLDHAYWLPHVQFTVRVCHTHLPPQSGSNGGAALQAALVIEEIVGRVARQLGVLPEVVRQRNFYATEGVATRTPADLPVAAGGLLESWKTALKSSGFAERRKAVDAANARNQFVKRGIAATPVKLAVGDASQLATASSALIHVLRDGSVQVFAEASSEDARSLVRELVSTELGAATERIRILPPSTMQVPETRGGEGAIPQLAEQAVRNACARLKGLLLPVIVRVFQENGATDVGIDDLVFLPGRIADRTNPDRGFSFDAFARFAAAQNMHMTASGSAFVAGDALPYHGFACGAAVSEVQVDSFTGEVRVLRSDLVHPAPRNSDAAQSRLRAGFVEGLGWLVCESLQRSEDGALADSVLPPTIADEPLDCRIRIVPSSGVSGDLVVGGTILALSVREALRDAISAFGQSVARIAVELPVPAMPEDVFRQVHRQRTAAQAASLSEGETSS